MLGQASLPQGWWAPSNPQVFPNILDLKQHQTWPNTFPHVPGQWLVTLRIFGERRLVHVRVRKPSLIPSIVSLTAGFQSWHIGLEYSNPLPQKRWKSQILEELSVFYLFCGWHNPQQLNFSSFLIIRPEHCRVEYREFRNPGWRHSRRVSRLFIPQWVGQKKQRHLRHKSGWWFQPLWKILVNWDDWQPNIWENKKWQPNHQPEIYGSWTSIICFRIFLLATNWWLGAIPDRNSHKLSGNIIPFPICQNSEKLGPNRSTNPNKPRWYPQQQKRERVVATSEHPVPRWKVWNNHTTTTQEPVEPAPNLQNHPEQTNPETHIGTHTRTNASEPLTRNLPSQTPHGNLHRTFVWSETPKPTLLRKIPFKISPKTWNKIPEKSQPPASPAARHPPPWSSASAPGAPLAPKPEAPAARGRRWWPESSRPGRTWIPQGVHGDLWRMYGDFDVTLGPKSVIQWWLFTLCALLLPVWWG